MPLPRTLQREIELFVVAYSPLSAKMGDKFIDNFRDLMNRYARAALDQGDIPQVVFPQKGGL